MNNLFFRLTFITNVLIITNGIKCDFDKFTNGCEDSFGSYCNKTSNECQCKSGFTIKIDDYCLAKKNLSEPCFTSAQCMQTQDSIIGCFIEEREINVKTLKTWISSDNVFKIVGICSCPPTHYLSSRKECVSKKLFNQNCSSSQECIADNSYCDQLTKKCKCKPTYRYSFRKSRCVSLLIGESCTNNEDCVIHDTNAECRIGSCQCRSGFILSNSSKCVFVRIRGTSSHLLMMLVVIGTAVVFALLSTAHRKWSTPEDIFARNRSQVLSASLMNRRTFQSTNNCRSNITRPNCHQPYPMPLSVPSLALIWPLRHQNDSQFNRLNLEEGPPSYAEAISQPIRQSHANSNSQNQNHDNDNNQTMSSSDNNNNTCNSTTVSNTNL